jgi:hypothetical protein
MLPARSLARSWLCSRALAVRKKPLRSPVGGYARYVASNTPYDNSFSTDAIYQSLDPFTFDSPAARG